MALPRHTIAVENLRAIPGYENVHPRITAVVERSGSIYKVCVTSKPVTQDPYIALSPFLIRSVGSVRGAMEAVAESVARTYGANYVQSGA